MPKKHNATRMVSALKRLKYSDYEITKKTHIPVKMIPWYFKHLKRVRHHQFSVKDNENHNEVEITCQRDGVLVQQ